MNSQFFVSETTSDLLVGECFTHSFHPNFSIFVVYIISSVTLKWMTTQIHVTPPLVKYYLQFEFETYLCDRRCCKVCHKNLSQSSTFLHISTNFWAIMKQIGKKIHAVFPHIIRQLEIEILYFSHMRPCSVRQRTFKYSSVLESCFQKLSTRLSRNFKFWIFYHFLHKYSHQLYPLISLFIIHI